MLSGILIRDAGAAAIPARGFSRNNGITEGFHTKMVGAAGISLRLQKLSELPIARQGISCGFDEAPELLSCGERLFWFCFTCHELVPSNP